VGIQFFTDGQYMVNVKEFNPEYHKLLMDIKTAPEKYSREQLEAFVNEEFQKLEKTIDNTEVEYTFDEELAAQIILDGRKYFTK
jgi:hypothetical protein